MLGLLEDGFGAAVTLQLGWAATLWLSKCLKISWLSSSVDIASKRLFQEGIGEGLQGGTLGAILECAPSVVCPAAC